MEYITSFERIGMQKGLQQGLLQGIQQGMQQGIQQGMQQGIQQGMQQGIQQGMQQGQEQGQLEQSRLAVIDVLSVRFATLPPAILTWLFQCKELGVLHALHRQAVVIPSLAEFEALLRQMPAPRDAENR